LLQPDPRSPNRLQRFACSCFSPSKTNPATSYLGLFIVSVSILEGVIVNQNCWFRSTCSNPGRVRQFELVTTATQRQSPLTITAR
jgi:hypothetical protein